MRKILAVAENAEQKKAMMKQLGASYKCVTVAEVENEISKNRYDFVIAPPEMILFRAALPVNIDNIKARHIKRLSEAFLSRSGGLKEQLNAVQNEIFSAVPDALEAESALREIYEGTADCVFSGSEWLELYITNSGFGNTSAQKKEELMRLYRDYTELFPPTTNEQTEAVILYILNNPESDLKLKTIASKMYVNSSYLSTVFAAQTGRRFVDYLTSVKLKRAAYLLMNSGLHISEIAERLDYKDIGYFSRLFRTRYGIPPSQYRIPDNYTYEI